MPEISKLAIVERGAKLADDVRVGPFTYIGPHVRIGPGCVIDSNVSIIGKTTLGERNHVLPLAVLGAGLDEAEGELIMGQANVVREHATIYAGPGQPTRIGTDNLIMIGCQIDAGATIGDHGIFVNGTHIGARAKIEDYVRTSSFVVVYPGVTVGAYTFTLGYGEMDRDCPPFAMVQGSPYRVRGVNAENLRRCGFGENDIRDLKAAFREIFTGPDDAPDAVVLKRMSADKTHPHLKRLAESIQAGLNGRSAT